MKENKYVYKEAKTSFGQIDKRQHELVTHVEFNKYINEFLTQGNHQDDALVEMYGVASDHETRLETAEDTLVNHTQQLANHEMRVTKAEGTLVNHENRITQNTDTNNAQSEVINNINERLKAVEDDNADFKVVTVFANNVQKVESFVATQGQTLFTLQLASYIPGQNRLAVYVDGVQQTINDGFVELDSRNFKFTEGLQAGMKVTAHYFTEETSDDLTEIMETIKEGPAILEGLVEKAEKIKADSILVQDTQPLPEDNCDIWFDTSEDDFFVIDNMEVTSLEGVALAQRLSELKDDIQDTEQKLDETNAQLSEVKNKISITPDDFTGTDIEKMQQALDYAIENDIKSIKLNRLYDITGGSIILPSSDFWGFILFEQGGIIKNDEGFIFDRNADNNNCNSPKLKDVFISTNATNVYLFNGDKMIRQFCDNVIFWGVGMVKTASYLQTIRLHNCEIGQLGCNFIDGQMAYDVEIIHNRFESSTAHHAIKIQTNGNDISYFGLRIKSNLFEGYANTCPVVLGVGYGLDISSNYFEANHTSIMIDNLSKPSTLISGRIFNNVFGATKSNFDVQILGTVNTHRLYVGQNSSDVPSGKYIFNKYLLKDCEPDTNNAYAGGQAFLNENNTVGVVDTGYSCTQIDLGDGGVMYEIPLNLKNEGTLWRQGSKQFLFNFKLTYGSTVWYSAHLTGILSIDGYYVDSEVKQGLHVDVLSSRNTSGNVNGNTGNPVQFECYFKESGSVTMGSNATEATIVFKFTTLKYDAQYNQCSFKSINSIMQNYSKDN